MNVRTCLSAIATLTVISLVTSGCGDAPTEIITLPPDPTPQPVMVPDAQESTAAAGQYEVWVIDQSDSPGRDHGGTLYIFDDAALRVANPSGATPSEVVDLAGATTELCEADTNAPPVRPHMVLFNQDQSHAMVAFVASGHVVIYDAGSREPLSCMRMSRSPTGQQAHAAFPSPDGDYVLVANQNGKRLERIDTDFANNRFVHNEAATLDLAACTTPNGIDCEIAGVRPDNAPICPVIDDEGDLAFVTLRGGGLLVVDPRSTPMAIVAEYDMETVRGNGCGGIQVGDQMYVNSGGRPGMMDHLHLYGFDVYRFPLDGFAVEDNQALAPNRPAPVLIHSVDGEHDSHGMVATGDDSHLWVMDRHADVVEVFAVVDDRHVGTIELNGEFTDNAAPDLTDVAPDGQRVYVAFRGPTPLSGDPHVATGTTPGMGILEVSDDGAEGRVIGLVRLTNIGEDGVERADPHGLRVRHLR